MESPSVVYHKEEPAMGSLAPRIPTAIFSSMTLASIALLFSIGHMCAQQEFLITCLLAVGCGGLYGLFVDVFQVELLSKYKLQGAATLSVAILLLAPAHYGGDHPPECVGMLNGLVSVETGKPIDVHRTAYTHVLAASHEHAVMKIKIVYPIGSTHHKRMAEEVRDALNGISMNGGVEASVWSTGSWKESVKNTFKDLPARITVRYRPEVRSLVPRLKQILARYPDFSVAEAGRIAASNDPHQIIVEIGM